jgi:hypothetical protein
MNIDIYEHNKISNSISEKVKIEIEEVLKDLETSPQDDTRILRANILAKLSEKGWSDPIRISSDTRITITSIYGDIGLCLQTGNMSRFYADLLKLQTLFCKKTIKAGIYIIPTKFESKRFGSNVAHFERLIDELNVFTETLTIPLIVYGFERSR